MKGLAGKYIGVIAALAIIGSAAIAFAGWGSNYGRGDYCGRGYYSGPCVQGTDLTDEQIQKMNAERTSFHRSTADIRQQLYEKELALKAEIVKEGPDAAKAASIQKEISELNGKLAQMRLEHRLEMKKIDPRIGRRGYHCRNDQGHHGGYFYNRFR